MLNDNKQIEKENLKKELKQNIEKLLSVSNTDFDEANFIKGQIDILLKYCELNNWSYTSYFLDMAAGSLTELDNSNKNKDKLEVV